MRLSLFFLSILMFFNLVAAKFEKVVIWGHKLHSHTHSYIHNAFFKAFNHLGYRTFWFNNADNVNNIDFKNSLFITEGQVDQNIPLRDDCAYILHNCYSPKYKPLFEKNRCIMLQVYTDAVLTRPGLTKIEECIYYDIPGKCVYMPWATDLLPHEIDEVKKTLPNISKRRSVYWVGTIGGSKFGNINEITPFKNACQENNISFNHKISVSISENMELIRQSYMAPTIVGAWQKEVGYVPCRIFKNISYGQPGITNSKRVYELFQNKIVYNPDTHRLFYDAQKKITTMQRSELYEQMDFVRDHHTYINRIHTLLEFFDLVQKNAQKTEL